MISSESCAHPYRDCLRPKTAISVAVVARRRLIRGIQVCGSFHRSGPQRGLYSPSEAAPPPKPAPSSRHRACTPVGMSQEQPQQHREPGSPSNPEPAPKTQPIHPPVAPEPIHEGVDAPPEKVEG